MSHDPWTGELFFPFISLFQFPVLENSAHSLTFLSFVELYGKVQFLSLSLNSAQVGEAAISPTDLTFFSYSFVFNLKCGIVSIL